MNIISIIPNLYQTLLHSGDQRVQGWPLVASPVPTMVICCCYVYFAKVLGPKLMENRKPFDLRTAMMAYNLFMTLLSFAIFYASGLSGWFGKHDYRCQPVDRTSADGLYEARVAYAYYLTKFVEFIDTIFFVLRKKSNQISTLHIVHHGIMPMSVWWGMKYVPGGHATFFGFVNSLVHVPMYAYYFLSAMGPQMQKLLFWKKYLTAFQMVQFVAIFTHSFQLFFRSCDFPKAFGLWIGAHGILFWILFSNFYKSAYLQPEAYKQNRHRISCHSNGQANRDINNNVGNDLTSSVKKAA